MDLRKRIVIAAIWVAVAILIALPMEVAVPTTAGDVLRWFVVVVSLGLAAVYLLDPWEVASRSPFEPRQGD